MLVGADDHRAVVSLIELILADLACQVRHHSGIEDVLRRECHGPT